LSRYFDSAPSTIDEVAALLRIGNKYEISDLREEAVNRICITFPSTLDDWACLDRDSEEPIPYGLDYPPCVGSELLWAVAHIAYDGGVWLALPSILLECASLEYGVLVDELTRRKPLLTEVITKAIMGKEKLTRAYWLHILPWLGKDYKTPGCPRPRSCGMARALETQRRSAEGADLLAFSEEVWDGAFVQGFCNVCGEGARTSFVEGSEEYWDYLPKAFGLGSWSELKKRAGHNTDQMDDSD
jgi:hypothetical protein